MTDSKNLLLAMPFVVLLFFSNCGREDRQVTGNHMDEPVIPAAEKLIRQAVDDYDPPRIRALADSLEKTGDISAVTANYYRGRAAAQDYDAEKSLEYLHDATANRKPDAADLRTFFDASATLAALLAAEGKYEEALTEAVPTLAMIDSLNYSTSLYNKVLLTLAIGTSQQNLHQSKEAAVTFDKTYQMLRHMMDADTTGKDFGRYISFFDGIATSYFNTAQYDKVKMWLDREDSVLAVYEFRPEVNADRFDTFMGVVALDQAEVSQHLGMADVAARYYEHFLQSKFSKSDHSRINAVDYLSLAGRYQEAAKNYEILDGWMKEWGFELTLNNIGHYLLPKMRTNMLAGRKDSAIAVCMQIVDCYDSALTRQKRDNAAELATIYDTKGKETLIAQQEARLSRTRITVLFVAIVLLTLFFAIYIADRQRAHRKLAAANALLEQKNKQLLMANARAEESARMKTDFIQQISHEIRTPLNVLSDFTQVVTMPGMELDDETKHDISRQITENTERITALVNQMLEVSEGTSQTSFP